MIKLKKSFTLIELLIVVGILVVLFTIVLIAINPARQFARSRDTTRRSNVLAILNAIDQNITENRGIVPTEITVTAQNISNTGADLCSILVTTYIPSLPVDPQSANPEPISVCAGTYDTNYQVVKDSNNRVTVLAPSTEIVSPTISVTR